MASYPKSRILKNRMRKSDLTRDLDSSFSLLEGQVDPVTNLAALGVLVTTDLPSGSVKYVSTLRAWFRLDKTSASTIVPFVCVAANNGGRWLRMDVLDNDNTTQSSWYIDSVAGNDENNGLTSGAALKTWAEFVRRFGLSPLILTVVTVTIISDLPTSDPMILRPQLSPTGSLTIIGTLTPVSSGTGTYTAIQARAAASNLACQVTDGAGRTWVAGQRITNTGGTAGSIGAFAWILADLTGNQARLTPLAKCDPLILTPVTEVNPATSDAYSISNPCRVNVVDISAKYPFYNPNVSGGAPGKFTIRDLALGNTGGLINSRIESVCPFVQLIGCTVSGMKLANIGLYNCLIANTSTFSGAGGETAPVGARVLAGGAIGGLNIFSMVNFDKGFTAQGVNFNVNSPQSLMDIRDLMAFDWGASAAGFLQIFQFGVVTLGVATTTGRLSGASTVGGSYALNIKAGKVIVPDATKLTLDGAAATDFTVNGKTSLPVWNDTVDPPVLAAKIANTWSNLTTTNDATHFGGNAIDPITGWGICKEI